jgi:hypothetical protein
VTNDKAVKSLWLSATARNKCAFSSAPNSQGHPAVVSIGILGMVSDFAWLVVYGGIKIIYINSLLHLLGCWDNLNPMIASKGQASVICALPGVVASVFSSGQVPKLRPIIIEVVVPSPA